MTHAIETGPGERAALSDASREALARIARINPAARPREALPDVAPERIPRHIAVIMDGNGRWANARGLARIAGHVEGVRAVERTIEACNRVGVEALTLYSFSLENWSRPAAEVDALMELCVEQVRAHRDGLVTKNIRLRRLGRREGLPSGVLRAIDEAVEATAGCTGPTLCIALNYGGRAEIADAARELARDVAAGRMSAEGVDEAAIGARLGTAGLPDPDLVIRTSGEMRVSNFLLWQISYSEIHVTERLWPEFGEEDLHRAIRDYARRGRRFGGV